MLLTTALIGPPLGATLFVADAAVPFVVDAVSFGLSALVLWRVAAHRRALRAPAADSGARAIAPPTDTGVAAMLREGAQHTCGGTRPCARSRWPSARSTR